MAGPSAARSALIVNMTSSTAWMRRVAGPQRPRPDPAASEDYSEASALKPGRPRRGGGQDVVVVVDARRDVKGRCSWPAEPTLEIDFRPDRLMVGAGSLVVDPGALHALGERRGH